MLVHVFRFEHRSPCFQKTIYHQVISQDDIDISRTLFITIVNTEFRNLIYASSCVQIRTLFALLLKNNLPLGHKLPQFVTELIIQCFLNILHKISVFILLFIYQQKQNVVYIDVIVITRMIIVVFNFLRNICSDISISKIWNI